MEGTLDYWVESSSLFWETLFLLTSFGCFFPKLVLGDLIWATLRQESYRNQFVAVFFLPNYSFLGGFSINVLKGSGLSLSSRVPPALE